MGTVRNNYKIGLYLERALNQKRMTINGLARETGLDKDLLQKYLINKKSPSLETIRIIAQALDKPVSYFTENTFLEPEKIFTENGYEYELRAHIANSDLMVNIREGDEKTCDAALKALNKTIKQIYNSVSKEGKEKIILSIYQNLIHELYPIAYEERNQEPFWRHVFTDERGIQEYTTSNLTTLYWAKDLLESLLPGENSNEEDIQEATEVILGAAGKIKSIQSNESDDEE